MRPPSISKSGLPFSPKHIAIQYRSVKVNDQLSILGLRDRNIAPEVRGVIRSRCIWHTNGALIYRQQGQYKCVGSRLKGLSHFKPTSTLRNKSWRGPIAEQLECDLGQDEVPMWFWDCNRPGFNADSGSFLVNESFNTQSGCRRRFLGGLGIFFRYPYGLGENLALSLNRPKSADGGTYTSDTNCETERPSFRQSADDLYLPCPWRLPLESYYGLLCQLQEAIP